MNKSALATSRPAAAAFDEHALSCGPRPVEAGDVPSVEDTMPSTPYTPRNPYAAPGASFIRRRPVGDPAGEHKVMRRGRFSAWPHVVIAFLMQTALVGALCAAPVWLLADAIVVPGAAGGLAFAAFVATGPLAAYLTFRHRWRCIEAFSSRYCVGLLNLSILYVPVIAFFYANVRAVQKIAGD